MKALTIAILLSVLPSAYAAGSDQAFVTKAGQDGLAEVAMGQLAADQGTNVRVRDFGKLMVTDHSKANAALKEAATAGGLKTPAAPSASQNAAASNLKDKEEAAFDKAYAAAMLTDHKEDIALFEKEARSGKSPKVKAFAHDTLPTLKDHLKLADAMELAVK